MTDRNSIFIMAATIIAFAVIWTIYIQIFYSRFVKLLETNHHDVWKDLKSPALNWESFIRRDNRWLTSKFIWFGRYRALNDPEVTEYGNRLRLAYFAGPFMGVLWALIVLYEVPR